MDVEVNAFGVILAMLSSMVVGMVWYARPVFGNAWIKLAKIDMKKASGNVAKPIIISAVVALITAYALAYVTYITNQYSGGSFFQDAIITAFWVWLGFVAARIITHDVFEGRPNKLTAITLGNEFVTLMLMGVMIGLVGV